jgi:hypothetical protein
MSYVRVTVIRPKSGKTREALDCLREIDNLFAQSPGLVMSFVFSPDEHGHGPMGRIAVWETESNANQVAMTEKALALRSRMRRLAEEDVLETLAAVVNSHYLTGAAA